MNFFIQFTLTVTPHLTKNSAVYKACIKSLTNRQERNN